MSSDFPVNAAPYLLRLLGAPQIQGAEGVLEGGVVQRHRIALLALLALAPRSLLARDRVMAFLWPEATTASARNLLNAAVHAVRRALGAEVLITQGRGIYLDRSRIRIDVEEFESAHAQGRFRQAIELYAGPFMDGFGLPDALEFEHWLDRERDRLEQLYHHALEEHADSVARDHGPGQAVAWWRRRASCTPTDSRVVLRLMEVLAASGDRAGALRAATVHATLLQAEFGAPPDSQVESLANDLRTAPLGTQDPEQTTSLRDVDIRKAEELPSPHRVVEQSGTGRTAGQSPLWRVRAPLAVLLVGVCAYLAATSIAVGVASGPAEGFAWAVVALRATVAVLTIGFLALLVVAWYHGEKGRQRASLPKIAIMAFLSMLAGLAGWSAARTGPASVAAPVAEVSAISSMGTPRAPAVAVFPFAIRGASDLGYLSEGMVDLLSVNLSGTAGLRAIAPQAILSRASRLEFRGGDLDRAREAAAELGSAYFILGSVVQVGRRVRISASAYPVRAKANQSLPASVEGEADALIRLVDDLTAQLLVGHLGIAPGQIPALAARTTTSLNALKAFLDGESALRKWATEPAAAAFRRAIAEDSTFALAYYRLAWTASMSVRPLSAGDALPRAVQFADRLPERERLLVHAAHAFLWNRDAAEAERLYRQVLAAHPGDTEANWGLGDVLFHYASVWGRPAHEIRTLWEKVLAVDPNHTSALEHLSWLAGIEGRHEEAARYGSLLQAITQGVGDMAVAAKAIRAFRTGESPDKEAALALLRVSHPGQTWFAAWITASRSGLFVEAIEIAKLNTHSSRASAHRVQSLIKIADIELARGRTRAADSALAAAVRLEPATAILARALFALRPLAPQDTAALAARLSEVAAAAPQTTADTTNRLYLIGLLHARLHNDTEADRAAGELHERAELLARAGLHKERARAHDFGLGVSAEAAAQRGDFEEALGFLGELRPQDWWVLMPYPFESQELSRWLRAELLVKLNRPRDAINWYAMFGLSWMEEGYRGPKYLRMGQLHDELGEHEDARRQYVRLLGLWENADPGLDQTIATVRARLQQLGAEGPAKRN